MLFTKKGEIDLLLILYVSLPREFDNGTVVDMEEKEEKKPKVKLKAGAKKGVAYTEENHAKIVDAVYCGLKESDAGELVGIGHEKLDKWKLKNSKLRRDLKKASRLFKLERLKSIRSAGGKSWQAEAWLLERKYNEEFGARSRTDITSKGEAIKGVVYMPVKKEVGHKKEGTSSSK